MDLHLVISITREGEKETRRMESEKQPGRHREIEMADKELRGIVEE